MNKSTVLKFLPIVSICILALATTVVCLGIFSNNAKAVSTNITITADQDSFFKSFYYPSSAGDEEIEVPYTNTDVIVQVVALSDNSVVAQEVTNLSTLYDSGCTFSSVDLNESQYYVLKFLGPAFSSWGLIVNNVIYRTDSFVFQTPTSGNLSVKVTYSQTQETWFDDTNMI